MLGIGGRFAGAKGMVQMPNLANLSPSAATTAIVAAGLRVRQASYSDTSNSGDNDKVFSQSVPAGSLVDYDSEIDYSYYRYVAPAVVYTLDSNKIYYGNTYFDYGCNQQPNQNVTGVPNASNQYFYCRREARPFRYKLLANGVWDGVSYGGYGVDYESLWTCEFIPDQCGNTELSRKVSSTGSCQPNSTRNIIYEVTYRAGNIGYVTVVESCTYVAKVQLYTYKVYKTSSCIGGGGCAAGYRLYDEYAYYSDNSSGLLRENVQECCPCAVTCVDTPYYYFSCENGERRCTYRTTCTDCTGTQISDTRYACPSLTCCTASCGAWSSYSTCISGKKSRTRTCTRSDCTTYTEKETVNCTGGAV